MTPTSIGGEKQAGISGGSQSPSWYSLRQDCRGAQEKYVMQLHDVRQGLSSTYEQTHVELDLY